jgi:bifunctional non-homologous end joining protein LigD
MMESLFDDLPKESRKKLKRRKRPKWMAPMLATLVDNGFSDPEWIFERKFDGERVLAFREGKKVRLLSRNKKELNATYPELVEAVRGQECNDFIVDGEVVAFEGNVTSFSRLQGRMQLKDAHKARESRIAVYYYLFDMMYLAGHDTTKLRLRERKQLLKRALVFADLLRFSAHRNECGEKYLREACREGREGLIAKDAGSEYVHRRSRLWKKLKCVNQQEFVIGGFTDPEGSRVGFGALLAGYYDGDDLKYAGMVGTGYTDEILETLSEKLKRIERDDSPFVGDRLPRKSVHWVKPKLVGEVGFTQWTGDGRLRHPRFLGLRRDKKARDVVRER